MKKYWIIILLLSGIKFLIQWIGNQNYGFHRDELLHLSVSEHLDWGFMEFPPMIGFIGKLSYLFFDYSLVGMRLFPTLAGVGILILCCLMAKELGGKTKAVFLAGICVLAFLPFYRNHTLFQPVAFDQFFWTLGFYFVIRYINSEHQKMLLYLGATLGLGLMMKYTMIVWVFGLFVGLFFYKKGSLFKDKWLYISGGVALVIVLPNIIWQIVNDYPILQHLQALKENQLDEINRMEFVSEQINYPYTLIVSLLGLIGLLTGQHLKKYRSIGVAAIVIFFTMWIQNSKAYYLFSIYPVLFASGAVKIESLLSKKTGLVYLVAAVVLLPTIPGIPYAAPILPVEEYISYTDRKEVDGRVELTDDYADMFGWGEQVRLVDSVYQSLSEKEKNDCVLWAENYGEAGALTILGEKYNLPKPICLHGSFWLWGFKNKNAAVWISLGNEDPMVEYFFEERELVKIINHKYAIGEENGIPLYICRKPKVDIEEFWIDYREHIFD